VQKGKGGENISDPPIFWALLAVVMAVREEDVPPLFLYSQKSSSTIPRFLGVCFIIFLHAGIYI